MQMSYLLWCLKDKQIYSILFIKTNWQSKKMEQVRPLKHGWMGEGPQNGECRPERAPNLGPSSSLEPRAVTSEVTALNSPPSLHWSLDKAGQSWQRLVAWNTQEPWPCFVLCWNEPKSLRMALTVGYSELPLGMHQESVKQPFPRPPPLLLKVSDKISDTKTSGNICLSCTPKLATTSQDQNLG